jgi:predicted Zn-dependent protease
LIYLETGNVTNALWNLKKQSGLVPKRFVVLVHLGLSYILAGDSTRAFRAFSDAARLDSANTKMYLSGVQGTFLQDRRDVGLLKKIFLRIDPVGNKEENFSPSRK